MSLGFMCPIHLSVSVLLATLCVALFVIYIILRCFKIMIVTFTSNADILPLPVHYMSLNIKSVMFNLFTILICIIFYIQRVPELHECIYKPKANSYNRCEPCYFLVLKTII